MSSSFSTPTPPCFCMIFALFFLLVDWRESFANSFLFFGSKRGEWEDSVIHYAFQPFSLIRSGTQSIPYEPPDESEIHIHLKGEGQSSLKGLFRIKAHWIKSTQNGRSSRGLQTPLQKQRSSMNKESIRMQRRTHSFHRFIWNFMTPNSVASSYGAWFSTQKSPKEGRK